MDLFPPANMPVILCPELSLTILKRLEAATSRLEDMVPSMGDQAAATNGLSAADQDVQRPGGTKQMGASDGPPTPAPLPPAIDDFDSVINGDVTKFVTMSEQIGGLVAEQVCMIVRSGMKRMATLMSMSSLPPYFEPSPLNANSLLSLRKRKSQTFNLKFTWRY